jgi:hypothetical protein
MVPKNLLQPNQQQNIVPINNENIILRRSPRMYTKLVAPSLATKTHLVAQEPATFKHGPKKKKNFNIK